MFNLLLEFPTRHYSHGNKNGLMGIVLIFLCTLINPSIPPDHSEIPRSAPVEPMDVCFDMVVEVAQIFANADTICCLPPIKN